MRKSLIKSVGIIVFAFIAILPKPAERNHKAVAAPDEQTRRLSSPAPDFLKVYKSSSSGKTGKSTRSVEILSDGTILIRDAVGQVLERRHLGTIQQEELAELLGGNDLMSQEITDCAPLVSTDSDFFQIGIEKKYKTVIFKIFSNCNLPQRLKRLDSLLTDVSPRK